MLRRWTLKGMKLRMWKWSHERISVHDLCFKMHGDGVDTGITILSIGKCYEKCQVLREGCNMTSLLWPPLPPCNRY